MAKQNKDPKVNSSEPVDSELQNIIEAALYASKQPLGIRKIMQLFPDEAQPSKVDVQNVLLTLEAQCEHRGIELRRIGKGWRFQSKEKYATWLRKLGAQKPPRYSRALLETLSIIAYRQPVTRGDIEEIRGVGVSTDTIRTLEEREWVTQIGFRDVPGRPALYGTTQEFLEYFSMSSLRELPELMDRRQLGEIAKDMNLTLPMDGVQNEQEADQSAVQAELEEEASANSAEIIELHPDEAVSPEVVPLPEVEAHDSSVDQVDGKETPSTDEDQQKSDTKKAASSVSSPDQEESASDSSDE